MHRALWIAIITLAFACGKDDDKPSPAPAKPPAAAPAAAKPEPAAPAAAKAKPAADAVGTLDELRVDEALGLLNKLVEATAKKEDTAAFWLPGKKVDISFTTGHLAALREHAGLGLLRKDDCYHIISDETVADLPKDHTWAVWCQDKDAGYRLREIGGIAKLKPAK